MSKQNTTESAKQQNQQAPSRAQIHDTLNESGDPMGTEELPDSMMENAYSGGSRATKKNLSDNPLSRRLASAFMETELGQEGGELAKPENIRQRPQILSEIVEALSALSSQDVSRRKEQYELLRAKISACREQLQAERGRIISEDENALDELAPVEEDLELLSEQSERLDELEQEDEENPEE